MYCVLYVNVCMRMRVCICCEAAVSMMWTTATNTLMVLGCLIIQKGSS